MKINKIKSKNREFTGKEHLTWTCLECKTTFETSEIEIIKKCKKCGCIDFAVKIDEKKEARSNAMV